MTIEIEDLKRVKIEPDECLLIKIQSGLSVENTQRIYEALLEALPKNTKILLYSESAIEKFQVVKQL